MATKIRPVISEKNQYYISRHRYYELKHFCMQYSAWKKRLDGYILEPQSVSADHVSSGNLYDKTASDAEVMFHIRHNIELVESCARNADPVLYGYILKSVTEGRSYTYLKNVLGIPCGKDLFYSKYRKFFYLLSQARG